MYELIIVLSRSRELRELRSEKRERQKEMQESGVPLTTSDADTDIEAEMRKQVLQLIAELSTVERKSPCVSNYPAVRPSD
jgi:hypothetical protein